MLSELFAAGGGDVNVTVRGGAGGVFQVIFDGNVGFDKAEEGRTPEVARAKEIKAQLRNLIEDQVEALAAGD